MSYATFDAIKIGIASPDKIREWSYGERKRKLPNIVRNTDRNDNANVTAVRTI